MKADSFYVTGMDNGGHFMFMTNGVKRAKATLVIVKKLSAEIAALEKALEAEDAVLKLSNKSLITDRIVELDALRSKLYNALKKLIQDYAAVPELAPEATVLLQAFKDYAIHVNEQRDRVSALMLNLINDLKSKYAQGVSKLGLEALVANFEKANQEVIDRMVERAEDQKGRTKGMLRAAREATDAAYRHFVEMLNAHVSFEGDADYADFIEFLNIEILHFRRQVLHQKGKTSTADGGGGDDSNSNDGDEEEEPPQG
ncbi:MAG: DUF6261 family protein [Prevotellaceae bacterium]|jgi:hypothetical protein|nr:DUF6261 family protein [Prevotellaceae bacterium]